MLKSAWNFNLGRFNEPEPSAPEPPAPSVEPVVTTEPVKTETPNGFPENTPLTEMTPEQREAYWKDKAQKHEKLWQAAEKNKPDSAKTAAELRELRLKAARLEEIEESQKSETEKAISEAEKRGKSLASQEFGQELAKAKFEAIAAGRIPDVEGVVEDLNLAKFLDENGRPNMEAITASVERFVALIPPATPAAPPKPKPDPSQGARGGEPKPTNFKDADKADFEKELESYGLKARS